VLEAAVDGLLLAVQWPAVGYLFLGIAIGMYFGAVPGLSGLSGMAILLPFTFGMDPVSAFSFLLGMYAVTTTSDSVTAILIGVPGTAAAQATVVDGYQMAKNGEAARAFGAAFTCSAIGGVLGGLMMGVSIPIVQPIVLAFAKPEFFMLGVLGLTMVGALSGGSILKGLTVATIGLLLANVGYAEQEAIPRYWLGIPYLLDGMPLVPVVLGIFAVPELVGLAAGQRSISDIKRENVTGGIMRGMRDALEHKWLLLRSSIIGIYIGILPGLGSTIADWVAYGHAVQSAKDKSRFGRGDVRGVIAPEAANNSVKGGELVPTVAFGIPGSAPMAILLGAFLIQGLTPGPEMLTSKLDVTYSMMWTLIFANVVAAVLLMLWTNQLQKIIFIPGHMIVPAVTMFVLMGAWSGSGQIGDWIILIVFGVIGVVMKQGGWPRAPIVLGFILGDIMENSLHLSIRAYGWDWLYNRPIVVTLAALVAITVFFAVRAQLRDRKAGVKLAGDVAASVPVISIFMSALVCVVSVYCIVAAMDWSEAVRRFPIAVAVPALLLSLAVLLRDVQAVRAIAAAGGARGAEWLGAPDFRKELIRSAYFFVWLAIPVVLTVLVGQLVAIPVFILAFLLLWSRASALTAAIYAGLCAAFLYVVFDVVVTTTWYNSILLG